MNFSHEFPTEMAFQHNFEFFGTAYLGIDWICPAFNFAAALAQASMALGKKHILLEQGIKFPNFYQAILGHTHLAAKSPTLDRAAEGVNFLKRNIDPHENIRIITSINSAEGFKEEFATHVNGDPDHPMDWYIEGNGVRAFIKFDELAMLLAKTNQKATSGISVELTGIYNPKDEALENNTRQNKSYGVDWIANVFGCSTLSWYEKFLTEGDFTSGFLNRFVFYLHEQQPINPRFDKRDDSTFGAWQQIILDVAKDSIQLNYPKKYKLSDECFEEYEKWYMPLMKHLVEDPEDIARQAKARTVEHVLKLALVYAGISNSEEDNEISLKHFQSAQAVGEYWAACSGATMQQIDLDMRSKSERRIIEKLQEIAVDGEWVTVRELRKSINRKTMSTTEFNNALEAEIESGVIDFEQGENSKKHVRINEKVRF